MSAADPFTVWLEGFKREVDAVVATVAPSRVPAADDAKAAFENWWQTSQQPILPEGRGPDPGAGRVDALTAERSELRQQLTQAQAGFSAEREGLTLRLAKAETQVRALLEGVKTLKEDKLRLEESARKAESANASSDEELRIERERALLAATELVSLKHKSAEQQDALAKLREAVAARDGTLEELRRQASAYQERLIHSKELTDADVALLRQELKLFIEEIRIMLRK
ncbi:MAG: hypothetical protein HY077_00350 [Elusimicrobia bacterium]|nr:hypothetical protein [Elusimicrobiota bacterium]